MAKKEAVVETAPRGPLSGLKVVELAGIGPGPFAAMLLADLGAEVVCIDRPGAADLTPIPHDADPLRRGRRSAVIDLRRPAGVDAVLEMISRADVLIEANRPGVAEKLGIGPGICLDRNPRLVYGRMTGWGQYGPLAQTAGHDITYLARTGALHAMGREGEPPSIPVNLVGDFGGGALYLAFGLLAAVLESRRSGRGQVVDAAIVDGVASLSTFLHGMLDAGMWTDARGTNLLDSGAPWYDIYETSDSRHVAIGALEPKFYLELMARLGLDASEDRRQNKNRWPEIRTEIARGIRTRSRDEWAALFDESDSCLAPVLSLVEARVDQHLVARGTFMELGGRSQPAPAPRFSQTPPPLPSQPARAGAHTAEVLRDWGVPNVTALLADGTAIQS